MRFADFLVRARTKWPKKGLKGAPLLRLAGRDFKMRGPTPYDVALGTDAADIVRRAREVVAVLDPDERARLAECLVELRWSLLRLYFCRLHPDKLARLQDIAVLWPGILRYALTSERDELPNDWDVFALQFSGAHINHTEID